MIEFIEQTILLAQRRGHLEPREHIDLMKAIEQDPDLPEEVFVACMCYRWDEMEVTDG